MKLVFAVVSISLVSSAAYAAEPRPNVVMILADDLGYADLGVQGCRDIPTPHIDQLAKYGVRCTAAYANGSFCTPTRAALMSGRYQHRLGMEDLTNVSGPLPKEVRTLPDRLRSTGYRTGIVGKWHLGDTTGYTPLERGFDELFGFTGGLHTYLPPADERAKSRSRLLRGREPIFETRYLTDAFGEEATEFVRRQRDAKQPFFLYLPFNAVHTPLEAVDKYRTRFTSISDRRRQTYAAMLTAMDEAVGRMTAALAEIGATERTLILFSSDNGGPTTRNGVNGSSNAPLRGSKCETFEGGIRVPLLIQWPGVIQPGTTYDRPVITFDLTATMLAAAGADTSDVEGVDLRPFLTGERRNEPHKTLFWRNRTRGHNYAAREGDWKFVHSTEGGERPAEQKPGRDMLFNLKDDSGEQHDLGAQHPDRLLALKQAYEAWSAAVDADCRQLGREPVDPNADIAPKAK